LPRAARPLPGRRPVERARRTLRPPTRYAGDGVAGIGLAGEESYPLEPFAAVFDADLVTELAERRIPLEVCPSSNVPLGLAPSLAEPAHAGVDASFAPPGVRARLHHEIDAWLASPAECPA
jgi:adenosine deaminase